MFKKKILMFLLCLAAVLGFGAGGARGAEILFISTMDDAVDPGGADDVLKVFMHMADMLPISNLYLMIAAGRVRFIIMESQVIGQNGHTEKMINGARNME